MWWYVIGRSIQYLREQLDVEENDTAPCAAAIASRARGETLNGESPGGHPSDFCEHE